MPDRLTFLVNITAEQITDRAGRRQLADVRAGWKTIFHLQRFCSCVPYAQDREIDRCGLFEKLPEDGLRDDQAREPSLSA